MELEIDNFSENYYKLGLRINKHISGYVEHYYGPEKLKQKIDNENLISPNKLLTTCRNLQNCLSDQNFEKNRSNFLSKNLQAIETIILILKGEKIPYLEKIHKLFDFIPYFYDDDFFISLSLKAENLYKGTGSLDKRIERYSKKRIIPSKLLKNYFVKALEISREKTNKLFPDLLPPSEKIGVEEVQNQSWAMYNWYQGNFFSRLDINISDKFYWTYLIDYSCHEAYPGHHTESAVRDYTLYKKKSYFEPAILLIYTPEMVIHEGIGRKAVNVLFNPKEISQISFDEFCLNKNIEDELDIISKQAEIRKGFMKLQENLAYHKYVDNWSNIELIRFIKKLKIISKEKIKPILNFILDELWAPYILVYQGDRLIEKKFGQRPKPEEFRKILSSETLPSDLK